MIIIFNIYIIILLSHKALTTSLVDNKIGTKVKYKLLLIFTKFLFIYYYFFYVW